MTPWIAFLVGVGVGWITKIPFLLKLYEEHKKDKKELSELYKRVIKSNEQVKTNSQR